MEEAGDVPISVEDPHMDVVMDEGGSHSWHLEMEAKIQQAVSAAIPVAMAGVVPAIVSPVAD